MFFFWKCRSTINNRINHIGSVTVTRVGFRILVKMPKYVVDYEQFNNNFFLLLNSLIFCLRQIFFSAFPRDGIFYFFWEFFFFGGFFQLFFFGSRTRKVSYCKNIYFLVITKICLCGSWTLNLKGGKGFKMGDRNKGRKWIIFGSLSTESKKN